MNLLLTTAALNGLWQGLALALLAAAVLRLFPRASASLRHTILVAVFALTAVLPWLHATHRTAHPLTLAPWIPAAIATAWLALAAARATALLAAWQQLRAIRRSATPVTLDGNTTVTDGTHSAALYTSSEVDSPTILGFRNPRLLLPTWMVPILTPADLRQIALHECEHLRRNDDWLNLALQLALVVLPLNPALSWLNLRIATERELACDAAVVRATGAPIAYATCLTRLAEQRVAHRRLTLALAAWGRQSELGQRVTALLTQTTAWTTSQSRTAAALTATGLLAASVGLAKNPLAINLTAAIPTATIAQQQPAPQPFVRQPHLVQTSYQVKPKPAKPRIHRAVVNQPKQIQPQEPHFLRTAYTEQQDEQPRLVPADFTVPYLVVPTVNGWLLVQL